MEICYVLVIICGILSANCENHDGNATQVFPKILSVDQIKGARGRGHCDPPPDIKLPTYLICILIVTMAIMLCAIIYLAIALTRLKRTIIINNERRQFSGEDANWRSCENVDIRDKHRNNGSTLTVNSGIINTVRYSGPETPTRTDNDIKIYVTKPLGKVPLMHRQQIEEIIQHALFRSQKTASTSLRELNELQNESNYTPNNSNNTLGVSCDKNKEINNTPNDENDSKLNAVNNNHGITTENDKVCNGEIGGESKEVNNEKPKEDVFTNKLEETKEVAINEIEMEQDASKPASLLEMEVYDTVPAPIRTSDGVDITDSSPLYDCPPSDSKPLYDSPPCDNNLIYECPPSDKNIIYECPPSDESPNYDGSTSQSKCNMLLVDPDTEYIMPLTRRDTSTYINARTSRK